MPLTDYSVRTINRQTGASEWVRVRAATFDDAREQVERMGLVPHEVRIDEPAHAAENGPGQPASSAHNPPPAHSAAVGGIGGQSDQHAARDPFAAPPMPGSPSRRAPTARIALLVSAIFNLFFAAAMILAGLFACFPLLFGLPLLILGIYELRYRNMLDDATPPPGGFARPIRTIAVLEIITIILGNIPSMICGIIILVNQHELDGSASPTPLANPYDR
jgi:hypothetical protein